MNDVRFKRPVRPGETIEIEVELTERLADAFFLRAKVRCEGKLAVRFDFACTAVPRMPWLMGSIKCALRRLPPRQSTWSRNSQEFPGATGKRVASGRSKNA